MRVDDPSHWRGVLLACCLVTFMPAVAPAQPLKEKASEGTVLFICEHGTVKSVLAKLLFDQYAKEQGLFMRAASRGAAVDSVVPPWMKQRIAAEGLSLGDFQPLGLQPSDLATASYVVSFDMPSSMTASVRVPRAQWDGLPPASQQFEASRDAIKARVRLLVDSLKRHGRP